MDLGLDGHVALVVGGTGLIGRAVVERLRSEGATTVVAARHATDGLVLDARLLRRADLPARQHSQAARLRLDDLTGREREVAGAVAAGLSNAGIAAEMFMSESTVKTHVPRILTKLGADNRVQIALAVFEARTER